MRKIFTLLFAVVTALAAQAKDYNVPVTVTVNDASSEQTGIITVVKHDGLYDLTVKNFILQGEDPMYVGNVEVKDIKPYQVDNATLLLSNQTVQIVEGDDPAAPFWLGPMLPPIPMELRGKIENGELRCYLDIDMRESLEQFITVSIGGGYQMPNASFETWHKSATDKNGEYYEPNAWHSFESATGTLAPAAGHHIEKSTDAHSGELSARIFSTSIKIVFLEIIANGTMTTGRMNAGNASAANTDNNAYLDMSMTDLDGAGMPFYTPMYSRPDSLVFWTKFNQGKATPAHPYATVSAVITDGTYYQDPEDKAYTNVVAKAQNNQIAVTGDVWTRISVPFVYTENEVEPKAVLITISTNADPGAGSNNDEVLVDDISFVYNSKVTDIKIKGVSLPDFKPDTYLYNLEVSELPKLEDVVVTTNSTTAYVLTDITYDEALEGYFLKVMAINADMSEHAEYTVAINTKATEIQTLQSATADNVTYYTLDCIQVQTPQPGKIYLVRKSDGTVAKILK